jgi:hypothetical protein
MRPILFDQKQEASFKRQKRPKKQQPFNETFNKSFDPKQISIPSVIANPKLQTSSLLSRNPHLLVKTAKNVNGNLTAKAGRAQAELFKELQSQPCLKRLMKNSFQAKYQYVVPILHQKVAQERDWK